MDRVDRHLVAEDVPRETRFEVVPATAAGDRGPIRSGGGGDGVREEDDAVPGGDRTTVAEWDGPGGVRDVVDLECAGYIDLADSVVERDAHGLATPGDQGVEP